MSKQLTLEEILEERLSTLRSYSVFLKDGELDNAKLDLIQDPESKWAITIATKNLLLARQLATTIK